MILNFKVFILFLDILSHFCKKKPYSFLLNLKLILIESASFDNQKLEARPKINKFRAPCLKAKNWRFKDRMNEMVKSRITLTFYIICKFFFAYSLKKGGFCYINFLISPHELFLFKILEDDQRKRTRQARDPFPPSGGKGRNIGCSIWPQSPSFP